MGKPTKRMVFRSCKNDKGSEDAKEGIGLRDFENKKAQARKMKDEGCCLVNWRKKVL